MGTPSPGMNGVIYKYDDLKSLSILIDELFYPPVIVLQPKTLECYALRREVPPYSFNLIRGQPRPPRRNVCSRRGRQSAVRFKDVLRSACKGRVERSVLVFCRELVVGHIHRLPDRVPARGRGQFTSSLAKRRVLETYSSCKYILRQTLLKALSWRDSGSPLALAKICNAV
jgi:hypothetical protein